MAILGLFLVLGADAQRKKARKGRKDGCHLREIESCINKLQDLGKRKQPSALIASNEGLNTICKAIKVDLTKCVKTFMKKCGTPLHREIADLIVDQMTGQLNRFCDEKNAERQEFLKHSPCMHKKVFSGAEYRTTCNNNFLATVDGIDNKRGVDGDKTHTAVCCGYTTWHDCTKKMVEQQCGGEAYTQFTEFMGQAFANLPNLACPMDLYPPKSPTCAAVAPRANAKLGKGKGHNTLTKYLTSNLSFLFTF